jgi:hypothetical protein
VEGNLTEPAFYVFERPSGGYRACGAKVPGCVVIHQSKAHASMLVSIAIAAIIEEEEKGENKNANVN